MLLQNNKGAIKCHSHKIGGGRKEGRLDCAKKREGGVKPVPMDDIRIAAPAMRHGFRQSLSTEKLSIKHNAYA